MPAYKDTLFQNPARLLRASTRSMRVSVERAWVYCRFNKKSHDTSLKQHMRQLQSQSTETRMERVLARNKRAALFLNLSQTLADLTSKPTDENDRIQRGFAAPVAVMTA